MFGRPAAKNGVGQTRYRKKIEQGELTRRTVQFGSSYGPPGAYSLSKTLMGLLWKRVIPFIQVSVQAPFLNKFLKFSVNLNGEIEKSVAPETRMESRTRRYSSR
jgi:hypothetical protein